MLKLLNILTWYTSKKAYLAPYTEDEAAKKAATKLWNAIDNSNLILVIGMILLTIFIGWGYFYPFNQRPGRHYHPKYWGIWGGIATVLTFFSTFIVCYFNAKNPSFDYALLAKVSAINALYSIPVYLIITLTINKLGNSNAYPIFLR